MSHDAANVYGHQTFLQGTVGHGYRLFVYKVKNLLPEDCKSGMQSVYKIFEPTSRDLSAWVQHFYMVSKQMVGRVCSFFFIFSEPTSRGLSAGVHHDFTVSKPTSK